MSVQVTVQERRREFDVYLGSHVVGLLRSEIRGCWAYTSTREREREDALGWFRSLRAGARAVLSRKCGTGEPDVINRRRAP